jgi:tocopherol O-methyltransferase
MTHESKVREFYNHASECYEKIMGDRWHFGDPEAERNGASPTEACEILEAQLIKLTGIQPGGWGLDFGSGMGGPTLYMAKTSSSHFVGVTNNERCTQMARQNAIQQGLSSHVNFLTIEDTGYQKLPFPNGCFDAVTFYESVCHLTDKAAFFREAFRVVKPGGILAGTDWLQRAFGENQTEEQIMRWMQPLNTLSEIPWHGTLENYRKMISDAGFEISLVKDLYEGVKCWNKVSDLEHEHWLDYEGSEEDIFRKGKRALDNARFAGVFTVGMFVAKKPEAAR